MISAEAQTPAAPAAPTTAAEVARRLVQAADQAFLLQSALNPHDPARLSMSGLGGCSRRAAYQLGGRTPTDVQPTPMPQAHMGTWIHAGFLPMLARALGGQWTWVEDSMVLTHGDLDIPGQADLHTLAYSPDAARGMGHTLVDLKTVGRFRFEGVEASGVPYPDHVVQVVGYAMALLQAGRQVRWVAWLYLDRDTGRRMPVVMELTDELMQGVRDRIDTLVRYGRNPDFAPRDERGPGLSVICDGCAFRSACWGQGCDDPDVNSQAATLVGDADVTNALVEYARASAQEGEWGRWKEYWRTVLGDTPEGTYTDGQRTRQLRWAGGGMRRNQALAFKQLEERGIAVPYARTAQYPKVTVVPVRAAD